MNANTQEIEAEQPTEETAAIDLGYAVETENECHDAVTQLLVEDGLPTVTIETPYDHIWADLYETQDGRLVTQFVDDNAEERYIETHAGHIQDVFDDLAELLASSDAYYVTAVAGGEDLRDELRDEAERLNE